MVFGFLAYHLILLQYYYVCFLNFIFVQDFHKGYFSENCCVLAEGRYCRDRGVFIVHDIALPPPERSEISR